MSSRRRANAPSTPPAPTPVPPVQQQRTTTDMTLPQVLQLMESRLRKLESVKPTTTDNSTLTEIVAALKEEYESRFDILATEINNMKDILLKLQSYTMDVNKTLLEERVHFLSETKENIVMTTTLLEEPEVSDE